MSCVNFTNSSASSSETKSYWCVARHETTPFTFIPLDCADCWACTWYNWLWPSSCLMVAFKRSMTIVGGPIELETGPTCGLLSKLDRLLVAGLDCSYANRFARVSSVFSFTQFATNEFCRLLRPSGELIEAARRRSWREPSSHFSFASSICCFNNRSNRRRSSSNDLECCSSSSLRSFSRSVSFL